MAIDKIEKIKAMIFFFFFFFFSIYKMYIISAKIYINAGVRFSKIRKTNEIWSSMKDAGSSMGVKNISDLVLKETYGIYGEKN